MKIHLPADVITIIDRLEKNGYEAYAVGGCVRDSVLGRVPDDWDITTPAKPEIIKSLFEKTIDTGLQHGTVTVMLSHVGYEVTTYRIDGEYEDSRHPKEVRYTGKLEEDLKRRDFTINAMAYSPKRGLVDIFGGTKDLERKMIRCVGRATERFGEDALRMMRALRFSSQLGFSIEEETKKAIGQMAINIEKISAERIRTELTKLLLGRDAGMIREAYFSGMTSVFLPEFDAIMKVEQQNPHHIFTVGEHTIRAVEVMNYFFGEFSGKWDDSAISAQIKEYTDRLVHPLTEKQKQILCLTMLFHDMGKAETKTVDENGIGQFYGHAKVSEEITVRRLRKLTYDNETIAKVKKLVEIHDRDLVLTEHAMRKAISEIGKELMPLLFLVKFCDAYAKNPVYLEGKLLHLTKCIDLWEHVVQTGAAVSLKDLEVSGKDIIHLGMQPGPQIGILLSELLEHVLEYPTDNQREILLEIAAEKIKNFTE